MPHRHAFAAPVLDVAVDEGHGDVEHLRKVQRVGRHAVVDVDLMLSPASPHSAIPRLVLAVPTNSHRCPRHLRA
jgi:hypothetical protein